MKYFLSGVNGAGKTTLLEEIRRQRPEFQIVKGSTSFMRFLGIDDDYEALRSLPHEEALRQLGLFMSEILHTSGDVIVDSHLLNLVRGKIKRVTGEWIKGFDAILLLNVSAETALIRAQNGDRDRALFTPQLSQKEKLAIYKRYVDQYKKEFFLVSSHYHIPSKILHGERAVTETVGEFLSFDLLQSRLKK